MTPAQELRALMQKHKLTRPAVAALAGVKKVTVDSWLAPEHAALHRDMAPRHLELIQLKLQRKRKA
jgi:hypothetical protein